MCGWNEVEKLCSSFFREGSREVSHKVFCHSGGLKDLEGYFPNINIQEARGDLHYPFSVAMRIFLCFCSYKLFSRQNRGSNCC